MAQAMLNHKIGDEVEFEVHGARRHHRITSIESFKAAPAAPATPAA
jgi:hypothetical protein